jgi:outer membrane protein assembly factor BamB
VNGHRRPLALSGLLATVLLLAACAWVALAFVPVLPGVGGRFAAGTQTPAQAHRLARAAIPDASWPMFGGSPARTRYAPTGLRPPFRLLYRIAGGGGLIEMPPAVAQGRIVFGTHDGLVVGARVEDGSEAWSTNLGGCIASSPAVQDGVVYIGWSGRAPCRSGKDENGGIVALSLRTGEVRWRFSPGNVEASPAIADGTLYFASFRNRSESRVYAMRLTKPRRIRWSFPVASKVASSPALIGRTLFVSAYNRRLYNLDTRDGRLRWETTAFSDAAQVRLLLGVRSLIRRRSWTEGGYYATPAVAYRRVFVGTIDGVFSAFDARTGTHRWSRRLGGSIYGSAALWNEAVYVGTTGGTFSALSARDGHVLWKRDLGAAILGSATVTNDRVYVATSARRTYVLDARTGGVEWVFGDGKYSPLVVAGERAFLVGKGRIYALENAPCPRCRPTG